MMWIFFNSETFAAVAFALTCLFVAGKIIGLF